MDMYEDKLTVLYENKPCYDILFQDNYRSISMILEELDGQGRKVCIVSDSNVGKEYSDLVREQISNIAKQVYLYTFTAGEINKNLETVKDLYEYLIAAAFDRNDILIALGGGVVGDLTGFTAATYLRGVRFIQMPTSLLSMVDSSVGGKTGVDFQAYKNMVGAFYMPKCVYMNLHTLHTLPKKEYFSGMGEIIKHGLIKDAKYYTWLKENKEGIDNKDYETLLTLVKTSCKIKRDVVERDPKEQGERALLNFGHTIGHAVEKLMGLKLLHGECVAIGMIAASYISLNRGYITNDEFIDIQNTIQMFNLPINVDESIDPIEILSTVTRDKKMDGGNIKFILLRHIGEAYIDTTVTNQEILDAIDYLMNHKDL